MQYVKSLLKTWFLLDEHWTIITSSSGYKKIFAGLIFASISNGFCLAAAAATTSVGEIASKCIFCKSSLLPSSAVIAKTQIKHTDKYKFFPLLSKTGHRPCVVCLELANLVSSSHFKYTWRSLSASQSLVLPNQQGRRQQQRPHRIRSVKATKELNVFDYVTENFTSS